MPWVLLVAAVGIILVMGLRSPGPIRQPFAARFAFTPGSNVPDPVISPNGRHIVYVAGEEPRKLWIRDLDREEPHEIEGGEGARSPFWSPDSQFIGFAADQDVKKISVRGGRAITLCQLPGSFFLGGSWSPDGSSIAFSTAPPARIFEIPAQGGEPKELLEQPGTFGRDLHFLPSESEARSILYASGGRFGGTGNITLKNLETGEEEVLAQGVLPVYSVSGHILFQTGYREAGLWALPFSIETLSAAGEAFPIAENAVSPSVATDGTLFSSELVGRGIQQLAWRDREGKKLGAIGRPQQDIRYPVLSADGRYVAASAEEENNNIDVWVHEVERGIARRLTFDPSQDTRPVWPPSGENITFQTRRQGNVDIFSRAADGTGEPASLAGTEAGERPYDWSADGKYLLYTVEGPQGSDLWYLDQKEDGSGFEPAPFLQTASNLRAPKFSPDGRFVAYTSDESGRYEINVQPFPEGRGKWQASIDGGMQPRWRRDGKELFYVQGDTLMAVEVTSAPNFSPGEVRPLFNDANLVPANANQVMYDVAAEGQRFVLTAAVESEQSNTPSIHVVQNWYEEFRDREQD